VNARFRVETRAEHIVPVEFYGDIRYFFLHNVDAGAVQDCGTWVDRFTGVESLQRLVGRVKVEIRPTKTFIVEEVCESMLERLRDALP
jgi:hypothetical protein